MSEFTKNTDAEVIDLIDLLDFTLSDKFKDKWRFKYSERFIKLFQLKILNSLQVRKPLKVDMLYHYLKDSCNYSPEQIVKFLEDIELDIYHPVILGGFKNIDAYEKKQSTKKTKV